MRLLVLVIAALALTGCSALMVGGSGAAGYKVGTENRPPEVVSSDSAISTSIRGKYSADPVLGKSAIRVWTYEGRVTLSGSVGNEQARNAAGAIATDTSGVKSVENQIKVD
jgi:hyperosmotically inducible periplasmic protein